MQNSGCSLPWQFVRVTVTVGSHKAISMVKRENYFATCIKSMTFTSRYSSNWPKATMFTPTFQLHTAPLSIGWAGRRIKHNSPALLCHGISIHTLTREQGIYSCKTYKVKFEPRKYLITGHFGQDSLAASYI